MELTLLKSVRLLLIRLFIRHFIRSPTEKLNGPVDRVAFVY